MKKNGQAAMRHAPEARGVALLIALVVALMAPALAPVRAQLRPSDTRGPSFEVVSVKANTGTDLAIHFSEHPPDGYRQANLPLVAYVQYAFAIRQPSRLAGLPEWARRERFDVIGRADRMISDGERRSMLREVLESRFGLRAHVESHAQPIYVLRASRTDGRLGPGLKLRRDCAVDACVAGGTGRPDGLRITAVTLQELAAGMLSNLLGRVVRDETDIAGVFDVEASWRPDSAPAGADDMRPAFFTAIEEQLGLRLEAGRGQVEVLIVDSVQRPTPD